MSPQECPSCKFNENLPTANYCQRCSSPLSLQVALDEEKMMNEEINKSVAYFIREVATNPQLMAKFEQFRAKLNMKINDPLYDKDEFFKSR